MLAGVRPSALPPLPAAVDTAGAPAVLEGAPAEPAPWLGTGVLAPVALVAPLAPLPRPSSVPPLDPHTLGPAAQQAITQLRQEGESENTWRSYRSALRYWAGWYQLRFAHDLELPLSTPAALQFIVDHAQRLQEGQRLCELPEAVDRQLVAAQLKAKPGPLSLATLEHRLSVLSKVHRLNGWTNPCQSAEVRELMAQVRRAYAKRGEHAQRKPALSREPLQALLATCDDSLRGVRDRALLLFAWGSGGRRRSEVAAAQMQDLQRTGPQSFVYVLRRSKTNPTGEDRESNVKPLSGQVGQAMHAWLQRSGLTQGPLFRRIRRGEHLGEPLSAAAVRDIVRARAAAAGLQEPYSAHSLRSGFVTEAVRQEVPLLQAMALTGHRSLNSFKAYYREDPSAGRAAQLLDD